MLRLLFSRELSPAVLLLAISAAAHAQQGNHLNNQPTPAELKATLLHRGDELMAAWKAHNAPLLTSLLTPDFTYVGPHGIIAATANVHGMLGCTVNSYRVTQPSLTALGLTSAVLITRQEQNISCDGHPLPPVMLMTDTYVLRNNQWLLLLHTEAPPETH